MFQFPANPTVGQQVAAPNGFTYQWDGVKWFAVGGGGGGGGGGNVYVGPTAPLSPAVGDMWFRDDILKLFVFAGGTWVVANPSGGGGSGGAGVTVSETAPANPSIGALWWDSSIGRLFVWDGGMGNEWVSVPWGGGDAFLTDAPVDGLSYGRRDGVWAGVPTIYDIGTGLIGGGSLRRQTTYLRDQSMAFYAHSINAVETSAPNWVYAQETGNMPASIWTVDQERTHFHTAPPGVAGQTINWELPVSFGRLGTVTIPQPQMSVGFNAQRSSSGNWEYAGPGYASFIQSANGNLYFLNAPAGTHAGQAMSFVGTAMLAQDGVFSAERFTSNDPSGYSFYSPNGGMYAGQVITGFGGVSAGGLGVQTTLGGADWFSFHWNGTDAYLNINNLTGWMQLTGQSDERLKQDIAPTKFDCLAAVLEIPVSEFRWRSRPDALVKAGLVAQQVRSVEPTLVTDPPPPVIPSTPTPAPLPATSRDLPAPATAPTPLVESARPSEPRREEPPFSPLGIDTNNMLAVLVGALQQLSERCETLAARVAELEAQR